MKRHLITALLLLVAVIFYSIGAAGLGVAFLVLGGVAELGFWLRLFMKGE